MTEIIVVDPSRCRMWSGHERLEDQLTEESCREEIASIAMHGQQLPVLAREWKQDNNHDYELIYGARRLFIAQHLKVPLKLQLRELSDREAVVALDIENRLRRDLSPYERGRSISAWLRAGLFDSQDELARVLKISPSQVSRLLKLAQLPTVLVNAFATPTAICENWGRDLMELWEDPERRIAITADARTIGRVFPRPSAVAVYQRLTAKPDSDGRLGGGRQPQEADHDEVVKDDHGNALFRVRVRRRDVAILLPAEDTSTAALSEIKKQVAVILQRARLQVDDSEDDCRRQSAPKRLLNRKDANRGRSHLPKQTSIANKAITSVGSL